jgi:chromosomal replication initiator protein
MPVSTYETWVKDTTGLSYADGQFIIGVPNAYARDWLSNRLRSNINRVLNRLTNRTVEIVFQVRER